MKPNRSPRQGRWIGAALAATIGASACCVGPLLLVTLGVTGASVGALTALEPVRPVFIALALTLFAVAYRRLYRTEAACDPAATCATPRIRRRQRAVFWLTALLAAALVAFPWYAFLFY